MIKVGDIVELIDGDEYRGNLHNKVTSISNCGWWLRVNGRCSGEHISLFKVVEDKSNWHKHYDLIVAWAKGAEIEVYNSLEEDWYPTKSPSWADGIKYRVEPEEPTELEKLIQEHKAMGETIDKLTKDFAKG